MDTFFHYLLLTKGDKRQQSNFAGLKRNWGKLEQIVENVNFPVRVGCIISDKKLTLLHILCKYYHSRDLFRFHKLESLKK